MSNNRFTNGILQFRQMQPWIVLSGTNRRGLTFHAETLNFFQIMVNSMKTLIGVRVSKKTYYRVFAEVRMTLFQNFIVAAKGPITKIIDKTMQLGVGMNIIDKAGQIPGMVDGEAFEVFLK